MVKKLGRGRRRENDEDGLTPRKARGPRPMAAKRHMPAAGRAAKPAARDVSGSMTASAGAAVIQDSFGSQ